MDRNDDGASAAYTKRNRLTCQSPPREAHAPPIPFELTYEILLRLPVRSLLRFRSVCKQWESAISDTHFAKSHLYRSTVDPTLTHHRYLLHSRQHQLLMSCSVKSLFGDPLETHFEGVDFGFGPDEYHILGSCNGLVCLITVTCNKAHVRLLNPSIRLKSRESPFLVMGNSRNEIALYHGFGYDHVSGKYKVVLVFRDPCPEDVHRTVTKVYAFGNSSWTTIQNLDYLGYPTNGSGRFVGGSSGSGSGSGSGTLNWVALGKGSGPANYVIRSFDTVKETFGEVLMPDFGDHNPAHPMQAVLKDYLCVCYDHKGTHLVVWLMKEYGAKESWAKLMAIPHVELQIFGFVPYLEPLCISESGMVLVNTTFARGVVYDPKNGRLKYPHIVNNNIWYTQYIHIESLVSPCF